MSYRLLLIATLALNASTARAGVTWNDGVGASVTTTNCPNQVVETLSTSYVGWLGDITAPPVVGSTVYVHVWWGVSGNPCTGGAQVAPELFLPAGAALAISTANPVKCFAWNFNTSTPSQDTVNCPQTPSIGYTGGLGFYPNTLPAWPSARGYGWEIQVPIVVTAPLDGVGNGSGSCHDCLSAATWMIDGVSSPWAFPTTAMITSGNSSLTPTITYANPANYNITSTGAKGSVTLTHVGLAGSFFIEHGLTPPASTTSCTQTSQQAAAIATTDGDPMTWGMVDFSGFSPGQTVYWRACFVSGTTTFIGATQAFTTTGGPPRILGLSRTLAAPGGGVTIAGSRLTGATVSFSDSSGTTSVTTTSVTDSTVVFTAPARMVQSTGTLTVTTAGGTATTTFTVGIDTIEDGLVMDALDGVSTLKNDVRATFHATEPGANMYCTLDNASTSQSCAGGSVTYLDLAAGPHTITVTASYGMLADPTPLVVSFTMADITAPNTYINSGPGAYTTATSATFTFSSDDPTATFECYFDRAPKGWLRCSSPITYSLLAEGLHQFMVRGRDAAGNVDATPATYQFTVALVDTTITAGPAAHSMDGAPHFAFTGWNAVRYECNLNNRSWYACTSGVSVNLPAFGSYTFQVRGIDAAGYADPTPASYAWSYF